MGSNENYSDIVGTCGKCGSEDLDYGAMKLTGDCMVYYPFTCNGCGAEGKEWYNLDYNSTEMN